MKYHALTGLIVLMLAGCEKTDNTEGTEQSNKPQELTTMTVVRGHLTWDEEYTATMEGCHDVEIYPQVSGTISRICVTEGQHVAAGELLFVIDQATYLAALQTATANVHAAEARKETAQLTLNAKKELHRERVIADYDLAMAQNALNVAEAELEQAKAQENQARNDLSYTEIKSPANGVVGRLPYRVGALVSASAEKPLTVVSDTSEMYVYFSMTESRVRELMREYGSQEAGIADMPELSLRLNDGTIYEEKGHVETISGVLNNNTGTTTLRCLFPNRHRLLFSGGIGHIVYPRTERDVIIIPLNVTYELQDKVYVYKWENGKARATEIHPAAHHDGKSYIVLRGLEEGDKVITEGIGVLRDGAEVKEKQSKNANES